MPADSIHPPLIDARSAEPDTDLRAGGMPSGPRAVAPWPHTAALIALFLALTVAGAVFQGRASAPRVASATRPSMLPTYLTLILAEWGMVYYVWKAGLRRRGVTMREVVGGRWPNGLAILRDVALAAGAWGVWAAIDLGLSRVFPHDSAASIGTLLPRGAFECGLWVLLSITAGFTEEFVFRGYLQRQFTAWTRHPWLGLLMQAALFGVAHGYQGAQATAKIALFGILFGVLALWRGSLRPGMIAHAATDVLAGIFRI
jgi:membrane protease YdiL (CAAX protease family)